MSVKEISRQSRLDCLRLVHAAQTSHIGSLLGAADLFAAIFAKIDLNKDKFILSAGWKACLLYCHLYRLGRITKEDLDSYCQPGSKWIGLAEPVHPDILFAGGSMGMGLAAGIGRAWSKKQRGEPGRVYVYESDGGMQVGINWEAAWFADQHKLTNLTLIVEKNGFQAMGPTDGIGNMENLAEKLQAFGFDVIDVNGHDHEDIMSALSYPSDWPVAIIAKTTKGKGWKRAEGNNLYHYKQLSDEEYEEAKQEIYG